MKKSYFFTFLLSIVLVGIAFFFHDKLSQFRSLGLIGIFLINLVGSATLFLPAPAIVSVVAGGNLYPPMAVALIAAVGSAIGDMVGYLFGISGKHVLLKKKDTWYTFLTHHFKQYAPLIIFFGAFIPNPFFDAIGIFAGVFGYSPYKFLFWMFIGRLLRNILLAFAGSRFL